MIFVIFKSKFLNFIMDSSTSLSEIVQYIDSKNVNTKTLTNKFYSYYNMNENHDLRNIDFINYQMRICDSNLINENLHTECPDYQLFDINRIKNTTVNYICNMNTGYGYGGGNEIGSLLSKNDITPFLSKCSQILKLFQTEKYDEITKLKWLPQYLKGDIFMKKKKNGIGFRPLTNAHPISKFIYRCLNGCINSKSIPNNFLNFASKPESTDKFISVREIAVNHKFLSNDFVQLDISKAFDNVEHNYLETVLKDLHLPSNVIKLIMFLNKNMKLYYNKKPMLINKSIQQGVPFSHFLFGFVTLHQFQHIKNLLLHDNFKLGDDYLINWFVDDMIVYFYFDENKKEKAKKIFNKINNVLILTGFTVNKNKCFATKKIHFDSINLIKNETRYLGMPYTSNKNLYLEDVDRELFLKYKINLCDFNQLIETIPRLEKNIKALQKSHKESPTVEKSAEIEIILINLSNLKDKKIRIMGKLNYILSGLYGCVDIYDLNCINCFLENHGYNNISESLSLLNYNIPYNYEKNKEPVNYNIIPKIYTFIILLFALAYMWVFQMLILGK